MFYTIYKTTNLINDKIYIGKHQTKNLNDGYMGSGKHLKYSISKYGIENFRKEILFIFDNEADMNAKEKELVTEEFCLREDTYNLCPGGRGGFGYINDNGIGLFKNKSETKQKIIREAASKNNKKQRNSPEYNSPESKLKRSQTAKKTFSKRKDRVDFCNKGLSAANDECAKLKRKDTFSKISHQQGTKNSQYGTCWVTNGTHNKKIKKEELDLYTKQGYNFGRINIITTQGEGLNHV